MDNINNSLPYDARGSAIQAGSSFRVYDDAGTAVESPKALATANEQLITVPNNAITISIYSDVILKCGVTSADVGGTGNGYFIIPADITITKSIAGMASFYLRNDSGGAAVISFNFTMV